MGWTGTFVGESFLYGWTGEGRWSKGVGLVVILMVTSGRHYLEILIVVCRQRLVVEAGTECALRYSQVSVSSASLTYLTISRLKRRVMLQRHVVGCGRAVPRCTIPEVVSLFL
jgi:hypothetical protein